MKLVLILLIVTCSVGASAQDDVYNFYFQKASGPTTVTQGGASAAQPPSAVATPANPETVTTAAAPTKAKEPVADFSTWEFVGGYAVVTDEVDRFRGIGLEVNYNFNKYVGVGAGINYAKDGVDGYTQDNSDRSPVDWAVGVTIVPVRIRVVGFDLIDIGFVAGAMSHTALEANYTPTIGKESNPPTTREVQFYTGPRLALNFSQNVGIITDVKLYQDGRYGQVTTGLAMRF